MKALRILLIILVPAVITAAMIGVLYYPEYYYQCIIGSFVLQDVMFFFLFPRQERKWDVISIAFPIVLHMLLAWGMLFYLETPSIYIAVAALHGLLQYIFLGNIYYFLYRFDRYQKRALPHVTSYLGIVNVYYAAAIAYAQTFYLETASWKTLSLVIVVALLIMLQNLWIHDITIRKKWYYILVVMLVLAQLLVAVQMLPSVYFVNALFIAIYYFFAVHLGTAALQKELTQRELLRNGIIAAIVVVLVVLTTRW